MTSSISLASLGVGSGLNDASLISTLVGIRQAPLTAMQTQQTNIQNASKTISSFASNLSALQTAANALSDPTQYSSYTASSSSSAIVASASSGAAGGTYNLQVTKLATAQLTYGNPMTSSTGALGMSGSLGITGATSPVTVNATDSLATIATKINTSGAAVSASVFYDGTSYRLQVQGTATGLANAVTFDESGLTPAAGSPALGLSVSANTYQSAGDATAYVNGFKITSPSNQVTGAIPGVTLALTAVTATAVTDPPVVVTIASNPAATTQKVSAFVTAYNAMVTAGHAAAGYGAAAASNTLLAGDRAVAGSLSRLSSLITADVPGADSTFQNLGSIGLAFNKDGTLSLDSTKLGAALASDPSGVQKLFVTDKSSGTTGVMGTISSAIKTLTTGSGSLIQAEVTSFTNRVTNLTKQQANLQAQVATYQKTLQAQFSAMESTVQSKKTDFFNLGGTGTFV